MHSDVIDTPLVARVQSEFREMPGLRLTCAQAQRLFGLDPHHCDAVLDTLVDSGFLSKTPTGTYVRATGQ